jgi:hypothetical protein
MTCAAREHVVLLQDLVEQDAVDEAAESQPMTSAGAFGGASPLPTRRRRSGDGP